MLKIANDPKRDKKNILYLLSLLVIAGYFLDILLSDFSKKLFILNTGSIAIVAIVLILDHFIIIRKGKAYQVVIYTLLLNKLLYHYFEHATIPDIHILRSTIIIIALISIAAFLIGKKHALIIGSILGTFMLVSTISSNSDYLYQSIILLLLVIVGYSFGVYYIIFTIEEKTKSERLLVAEIQSNHNNTTFLNSLAFELAEMPSEIDIEPLVLERTKNHTNAKLAVFNVYDPNLKVLKVKSIESSGALLKTAISVLGENIVNTISPVSNDIFSKMHSEQIGFSNSLTEVSFGSIPENVDKAFRSITGIKNFYGIAHFFSGKLYGTTLLGYKIGQPLPKEELLKSYAHLVAISLRRNIAEKSLIQNEAKLRNITTNISDVVFTADMNLNTTYISPSVFKLTGEKPEDYISGKVEKKISHSSLKNIISILDEELELEKDQTVDRNRSRVVELELIKPNGNTIDVSTHLTFIRDEEGNPIGIQGITRDITNIKKTHKQLEEYTLELKELNADKDRFMQILAHDLKSPFNAIMGLTGVLVKNFNNYEKERIREILDLLNQTTHNTYIILEELLLWSMTQSKQIVFIPIMLDIAILCKQVVSEIQPIADKKNITIILSKDQELNIKADNMMVKTILRNLINNAIKFSRNSEPVKINFEKDDKQILVAVQDMGEGIMEEDLKKLWNFSNPHTTRGTDNEKGTGLGLLICKEFVEKHGGKIWVDSEPGKGATFYFTLCIDPLNHRT